MRQGNYMIYRLYNKELDDYTTEFFLPDTDLRRRAFRLASLMSLKEKGYRVAGILYVDKEAYLNARLTTTVEEYLYMDNQEHDVRVNFRSGSISSDVAVRTLEMIQDRKWSLLKLIYKQIQRMVREDLIIENEIALALYDQYLKAVL